MSSASPAKRPLPDPSSEQEGKDQQQLRKKKRQKQTDLTSFFSAKRPSLSKKKNIAHLDRGRSDPIDGDGNDNNIQDKKPAAASKSDSSVTQNTTNAPAASSKEEQASSSSSALEPIIPRQVPRPGNIVWNTYKDCVLFLKRSNESPRTKVAAFDLDGTLLVWRISGWPSKLEHYELWSASVPQKLRQLYDDGYKLLIVTNQGAIRKAFDGKKASTVKTLLHWLESVIDRPISVIMSTNKKAVVSHHKPSPLLWTVAQERCNRGVRFKVKKSFFVGDSVGEDDPQGGVDSKFAENVSKETRKTLKFYTPEEYFGPSDATRRKQAQSLCKYARAKSYRTRAAWGAGYLSETNDEYPFLIVLCGVQGSGKSTLCKQLPQSWIFVSQDTINNGKPGKREKVEDAAAEALRKGKCVVVDRTHLTVDQRAHFVQVAQRHSAPVHAIFLRTDKETIMKRVKNRTDHPGKVQGEQGVRLALSALNSLVEPSYDEGFSLIHCCTTTEESRLVAEAYCRTAEPEKVSSFSLPKKFTLADGECLPTIVLGTMGLGKRIASNVIEEATNVGFGAVDTAPTYKNEDVVGDGLLKQAGPQIIVKIPKRVTQADQVRPEFETSLSKLRRKSADILLLHWPCDVMAAGTLKAVWEAMEACQKDGLCKSLGVCNFNMEAIAALLAVCSIRPVVNQVERHPLLPQWELVDFCLNHSIRLLAHSPLGQGKLLDHHAVQRAAAQAGKTAAQVLLQWNLQHGVAVAPKASSKVHLLEAIQSASGEMLTPAAMKILDTIKERKRFVSPPFMFGKELYAWAERKSQS